VKPALSHGWSLDEDAARALQHELAQLVVTDDRLLEPVTTVAGVDVAYADEGDRAFAAVAIINVSTGGIEKIVSAEGEARFPYAPGLLSFRELPVLAAALAQVSEPPDLVICDGQGIAHPRRFGLACHLGVVYDIPTIGCGKTRLIGEARDPGTARGSTSALVSAGETVGAVVRTREGVKPLYVSVGHRISLPTACRWILDLSPRYRIPEPIRLADQRVRQMKRDAVSLS
jgi:deoxyribonuclease V